MTEREQLDLRTLDVGDNLQFVTGEGHEERHYNLAVEVPGDRPVGTLSMTGPDGETAGPAPIRIEGGGNWTTPDQNPCQRGDPVWNIPRQEIALTIGWGLLRVGDTVVINTPDGRNRHYLGDTVVSFALRESESVSPDPAGE